MKLSFRPAAWCLLGVVAVLVSLVWLIGAPISQLGFVDFVAPFVAGMGWAVAMVAASRLAFRKGRSRAWRVFGSPIIAVIAWLAIGSLGALVANPASSFESYLWGLLIISFLGVPLLVYFAGVLFCWFLTYPEYKSDSSAHYR